MTISLPNLLRSLILLGALAVACAVPTIAAADTAKQATASMKIAGKQVSAAAWGRHLVVEFLTILQRDDPVPALTTFLDPAFQIQRANGSREDKASYLADPAKFGDFEVSGYRVTRGGTIIVASFSVTAKETISGVVYKKTPAPRIATFRFDKGRWTLISYGNFNAPS
jgi:ethanolamine utilization microcompartment shell protein EutL